MGRVLTMAALIIAGEAVFGLPFHITRYFRPSFLEVFGYSQTQVGIAQSIYGVTAMISYPIGGLLADRFPVRWLLAFSLLITGLSGFYLSASPSFVGLQALYAFWGFSTILFFWAALIKATRAWGGHTHQGLAFGILDGGRGLFAWLLGRVALVLFATAVGAGVVSAAQKTAAVQTVVATYTYACFIAAVCVLVLLPRSGDASAPDHRRRVSRQQVWSVLRMKEVWLQAMIIVCAYSMFKAIDYYSQYAKDIWGWSDVDAGRLSVAATLARPVAAIGCGLLADRISSSLALVGCFLLSAVSFVAMVMAPPAPAAAWMLTLSVLTGCLGVFAMRGVYFALLEESSIPPAVTGAAVGVISFIGFTPEIYMPLIGGSLIDHWDGGRTGYVALYCLLASIGVVGVVAAGLLYRINRRNHRRPDEPADAAT